MREIVRRRGLRVAVLVTTTLLLSGLSYPPSSDAAPDVTALPGTTSNIYCEWYGSFEHHHSARVDYDDGGFQQDNYDASGQAGPQTGDECRGSVTYLRTMSAYVSGSCYYTHVEGGGPADYQAYIVNVGEWAGLGVSFTGDSPAVGETGWGTCDNPTRSESEPSTVSGSCAMPGVSWEMAHTMQAIVTSCGQHTEATSTDQSSRSTDRWAVAMRRDVCDVTVDSDGGGVGDCDEYDQGTDPANPGDDFPGDLDDDGVADNTDNCPNTPNANQSDGDHDGVGDLCEGDFDADGVPDDNDNCRSVANPTQADEDLDGVGDPCDPSPPPPSDCKADTDGDGVGDDCDNCPVTSNPDQADHDANGVGDVCDPPYMYAPLVRFHPNETAYPISMAKFVSKSKLMFGHSGCADSMIAGVGDIDPARLGGVTGTAYRHKQRDRHCLSEGSFYRADDFTRPGDKSHPRHGLDANEGFYLDLDHRSYHGDSPNNAGVVKTPLSYDYEPGQYITYWFMYGWNPGAPGIGHLVDRHEGEWERVTVRLDGSNHATSMDFYAHECSSPINVPWSQMTDSNFGYGEVVGDTHPVVYSALGAHASYPDVRKVPKEGVCEMTGFLKWAMLFLNVRFGTPIIGQGAGDVTSRTGAQWTGWSNLRNARNEPWYGFGGAWGHYVSKTAAAKSMLKCAERKTGAECADLLTVTGPLGPDWKNPGS